MGHMGQDGYNGASFHQAQHCKTEGLAISQRYVMHMIILDLATCPRRHMILQLVLHKYIRLRTKAGVPHGATDLHLRCWCGVAKGNELVNGLSSPERRHVTSGSGIDISLHELVQVMKKELILFRLALATCKHGCKGNTAAGARISIGGPACGTLPLLPKPPVPTFGARLCNASPAAGRTLRAHPRFDDRKMLTTVCRRLPFVALNQLAELRELFGSQLARAASLPVVTEWSTGFRSCKHKKTRFHQ